MGRHVSEKALFPGVGSDTASGLLDMDPVGDFLDFWQCTACTFANQDLEATACEICNAAR